MEPPINSKARTTRNGTHMIGSQELAEAESHPRMATEKATGEMLPIKLEVNKKLKRAKKERSLLRMLTRRSKVPRQLKKEKRLSHKKRRKKLKNLRRKASLWKTMKPKRRSLTLRKRLESQKN